MGPENSTENELPYSIPIELRPTEDPSVFLVYRIFGLPSLSLAQRLAEPVKEGYSD